MFPYYLKSFSKGNDFRLKASQVCLQIVPVNKDLKKTETQEMAETNLQLDGIIICVSAISCASVLF